MGILASASIKPWEQELLTLLTWPRAIRGLASDKAALNEGREGRWVSAEALEQA